MIIECPKCRKSNLVVGKGDFLSRNVTNVNKAVPNAYAISIEKVTNIHLATCQCGFVGSVWDVNIRSLMSDENYKP